MFDLMNNIDLKRGLSPVAAVTDNTAFVSQIADLSGARAAVFAIMTGALADADATFAVLFEHGDVANLSDAAAVPDSELVGTEALAGFTFAEDDSVLKIGYRGTKRYIRVTVTPAANSGDVFMAGVWIIEPLSKPSANPPA